VTLLYCNLWAPKAASRQRDFPAVVSEDAKARFSKFADVNTLWFVCVDEASLLNATLLHHLSFRLQNLLGCPAPFGGCVVVLGGHFFQKEATCGASLYKALIDRDVPVPSTITGVLRRKPVKKIKCGLPSSLTAEHKGLDLFTKFRRFELLRSHRFRTDPAHASHMADMCDITKEQPISDSFLQSLRELSEEEAKKPEFMEADVGVTGNHERQCINAARAYTFAKSTGQVLVRWRVPLTGAMANCISSTLLDELAKEESSLYEYYVYNAKGMLTKTIAQQFGLVNGCRVRYKSLIPRNMSMEQFQAWLDSVGPGGVLTLDEPPDAIVVEPILKERYRVRLEQHGISGSDESLSIAVLFSDAEVEEWVPSSLCALFNGLGYKKRRKLKDGKISKQKSTGLFYKAHGVTLAYAVTDFKLQGQTLNHMIMSASDREFQPALQVNSIYVWSSRVRNAKLGLRVLKVPKTWDHLRSLRHPLQLAIWEGAYGPDGKYDKALAVKASAQLAEKIRERKRKPKEKMAKTGFKKAAQTSAEPRKQGAPPVAKQGQAAAREVGLALAPKEKRRLKHQLGMATAPAQKRPNVAPMHASGVLKVSDNVAPQHPSGLPEVSDAWLHSNRWFRNSCGYDSSLKAVQIGIECMLEVEPERVVSVPPTPAESQCDRSARSATVGRALFQWLKHAWTVPYCTSHTTLQQAVHALNAARNNVRNEVLRHTLLREQQQRVSRRARTYLTEEQVLTRLRSAPLASVHTVVSTLLEADASVAPNFFAGKLTTQNCASCHTAVDGVGRHSVQRVHFVDADDLVEASGDPLKAFAARWIQPRRRPLFSPCSRCNGTMGISPSLSSCFVSRADPPPLLAIAVPPERTTPIVLGASSRDSARLEVVCGGAYTYRLVSLIYHDPSCGGVGHFVTVGRAKADSVLHSDQWVLWDGLPDGIGCPMEQPPTGGNLDVVNKRPYRNYAPSMLFYCYVPEAILRVVESAISSLWAVQRPTPFCTLTSGCCGTDCRTGLGVQWSSHPLAAILMS
jgi:hypothetical protein